MQQSTIRTLSTLATIVVSPILYFKVGSKTQRFIDSRTHIWFPKVYKHIYQRDPIEAIHFLIAFVVLLISFIVSITFQRYYYKRKIEKQVRVNLITLFVNIPLGFLTAIVFWRMSYKLR